MGNEILNSRWLKHVRGVIQIGMGTKAAATEEVELWRAAKIKHQIYIEAHKPYCDELEAYLKPQSPDEDVQFFKELAISCVDGVVPFYITNVGNSSSTFPIVSKNEWNMFNVGATTVTSRRLTTLVNECNIDMRNYNLLYMDIQGGEGDVIKSGLSVLSYFDFIGAELFVENVYHGHMLYDGVVKMLDDYGFYMMSRQPGAYSDKHGMCYWDAMFVRKTWAIAACGPGYPGGFEEYW